LRGIFLVEPAAEVEEGEQKQKEKRTGNGKNEARLASRVLGRMVARIIWIGRLYAAK